MEVTIKHLLPLCKLLVQSGGGRWYSTSWGSIPRYVHRVTPGFIGSSLFGVLRHQRHEGSDVSMEDQGKQMGDVPFWCCLPTGCLRSPFLCSRTPPGGQCSERMISWSGEVCFRDTPLPSWPCPCRGGYLTCLRPLATVSADASPAAVAALLRSGYGKPVTLLF